MNIKYALLITAILFNVTTIASADSLNKQTVDNDERITQTTNHSGFHLGARPSNNVKPSFPKQEINVQAEQQSDRYASSKFGLGFNRSPKAPSQKVNETAVKTVKVNKKKASRAPFSLGFNS